MQGSVPSRKGSGPSKYALRDTTRGLQAGGVRPENRLGRPFERETAILNTQAAAKATSRSGRGLVHLLLGPASPDETDCGE